MEKKPGFKTTEFWVTVAVQVVGLMAAAGVFTSEQAQQWQRVAEMAGGLITMIVSNVVYAQSRAKVKAAESQKTPDCGPPDSQAGSASFRAVLGVMGLSIAGILIMVACTENLKTVSEMTPKEKATFFMSVYNKQSADYRATVAKPDLTEAQKTILRDKKKIMTEVYPVIELYVGYVDAGALPDQTTERLIIDYLDRLVAMSTK